jgi:putative endonuclease
MYYVYIIKLSNNKYYVGKTKNLIQRFKEHNLKKVKSTKKFQPCKLITYIAFSSKQKANNFELYLKTGSGFAFRNKRLI